MNYVRRNPKDKSQSSTVYIWLIIGFIFGFCPPIQTTINSALGQQLHSSIMASLVSFTVGTIVLFILTLIFNKSLKVATFNSKQGKLKPIYFIGGILGCLRNDKYYLDATFRCCADNDYCDARSNANGYHHRSFWHTR